MKGKNDVIDKKFMLKNFETKKNISLIVEKIIKDPSSIFDYSKKINEIFQTESCRLEINENNIQMINKEDRIGNWSVILLEVKEIVSLEDCFFMLKLLIFSDFASPQITEVPFSELDKPKWVQKLGVEYDDSIITIQTAKSIIQKMAIYVSKIPEYQYEGWCEKLPNAYIMKGEILEYTPKIAQNQMFVKNCNFVFSMLNVAPHQITFPIFTMAIAALNTSQMKATGEYIRTTMVVKGQTQSKKTSIVCAFMNFHNPYQSDINFESTLAAITRKMTKNRDHMLIIDDLKPASTTSVKNENGKKLEYIVRAYADNSGGRQIVKHGSNVESYTANGLGVITAEEIPETVSSSLARMLVIEMNRSSVDEKILTEFQNNHNIYGEFVKDFILYISKIGIVTYSEKIKKGFLILRRNFRNKVTNNNIFIDNRTVDTCSFLQVYWENFLEYAKEIGVITEDQIITYSTEMEEILVNLMIRQAETVSDNDEIIMFFKALRYLIDTKQERIVPLKVNPHDFEAVDHKNAIGFSKKGHIYLKAEETYSIIKNYYKKKEVLFPASELTLKKRLAGDKIIEITSKDGYTTRLTVSHTKYQVLLFDEKIFYKKLRGGDFDDEGRTLEEVQNFRELYAEVNNFI